MRHLQYYILYKDNLQIICPKFLHFSCESMQRTTITPTSRKPSPESFGSDAGLSRVKRVASQHWRFQGGRQGRALPSPGPISIFVQCLVKINQNNRLAPSLSRLVPPPLGNPGSATGLTCFSWILANTWVFNLVFFSFTNMNRFKMFLFLGCR